MARASQRGASRVTLAAPEATGHYAFSVGNKTSTFDVEAAINADNEAVARRQLREVFTKIDTNGDGRIDAVDVMVSLRRLGNKCTKQEAADVLWEVDDSGCGWLTWQKFEAMHARLRESKGKYEPWRMQSLIEFMLFDADDSGFVDEDEVRTLLRRRYGKLAKDSTVQRQVLQQLDDAGGRLSFTDFIVHERLVGIDATAGKGGSAKDTPLMSSTLKAQARARERARARTKKTPTRKKLRRRHKSLSPTRRRRGSTGPAYSLSPTPERSAEDAASALTLMELRSRSIVSPVAAGGAVRGTVSKARAATSKHEEPDQSATSRRERPRERDKRPEDEVLPPIVSQYSIRFPSMVN